VQDWLVVAGADGPGLDEGILSFCLPYSRVYVESR
jgi:hypothetical protein